jgi:hypothetical protein
MPLNVEILKSHPNPVFVETGTYLGDGVRAALEAGFGRIWTVDIDPDKRWTVEQPLPQSPDVVFATGDSAMFLADLAPTLESSATFWLDAHPVGYFRLLQPDLPLVNELLALSFSPRRPGDIILIDDIRLFGSGDRERLVGLIRLLWPECGIDLIDSSIIPQDILRVRNLASP